VLVDVGWNPFFGFNSDMTYDIAFDEVWRFVEVVLEGMRRGRVEGGSGGPGSKDSDVLSSARHPISDARRTLDLEPIYLSSNTGIIQPLQY